MGGVRGTYGGGESCIKDFCRKRKRKRGYVEDLGVCVSIILQCT